MLRFLVIGCVAEVRQRIRHSAFFATCLALGLVCFSVAAGDVALSWGGHRGALTASWIGINGAVVTLLLLSLVGFYLVRGTIPRDRRLGVDATLGSAPISPVYYLLVKVTGNLGYLLLLVILPLLMSTLVLVFAHHELPAPASLVSLWYPFIVLVVPVLAGVAGTALLFDAVPILRGAGGSVVYFFLWCFLIAAANASHPGSVDLVGLGLIKPIIRGAVMSQHPAASGFFDISTRPALGTFLWPGLTRSPSFLLDRLVWALPALCCPFMLAPWFQIAERGPVVARTPAGRIQRFSRWIDTGLQRLELARHLPRAALGRLVLAEIAVGIKGQSGWWMLGGIGIVGMSLVTPLATARALWYPLAALWALPMLSGLGNRELHAHTAPTLYAVEQPTLRHLGAGLVGAMLFVAALLGGFLLRAVIQGTWVPAIGATVTILTMPALAIALGVATGGPRAFELLFTLAWYLGPFRGSASLDFLGRTPTGGLVVALWLVVPLEAIAYFVRARQLRLGRLV